MSSPRVAIISTTSLVAIFLITFFVLPNFMAEKYDVSVPLTSNAESSSTPTVIPEIKKVDHIPTPENVKGIYMTSWIASSAKLREGVIAVADTTEINSIVLDIKDATGKVSFLPNDPYLQSLKVGENRDQDIDALIQELHDKNIYVIARLAVFEDPYLSQTLPQMAVHRKDNGGVWKDHKGISWIDPGSEEYWKYIVALANEAHDRGFDEIQFDYIRFPSDGDMQNISYPFSEGKVKAEVLGNFFKYLHDNLSPKGLVISADLFGMTTTASEGNDLGIGQNLEKALSYMDYVSPMVYPSHYPATWSGFANPADHPYDVIKISMGGAIAKLNALKSATTTPSDIAAHLNIKQLRPWLQDFDLGADYGTAEVKAQIQATEDLGLNSWLIWAPSNHYTVGALKSD